MTDLISFNVDFEYFKDYVSILRLIDEKALLYYEPDINKNIIELVVSKENIIIISKIPILETNIDYDFFVKIPLNISYTNNHNSVLCLTFDKKTLSITSNYNNSFKPIQIDNRKFYTLRKQEETGIKQEEIDVKKIENYDEIENKLKFLNIIEQKFYLNEPSQQFFKLVDITQLQNVICYLHIDFTDLKELGKILGFGKIKVSLEETNLTLTGVFPKENKTTKKTINVTMINKPETNFVFYVDGNSFSKLSRINIPFHVVPYKDKKIFKSLEIKIVSGYDNMLKKYNYGLTIFPGNLVQPNIEIYNSIMIYIPEIK